MPRKTLATLGATALLGAGSFAATVALVAVAPSAGATTVSTEQEFRDAWGADAEITLANDITLTCGLGGRADRDGTAADFVLDGAGHTITQTCAGRGVLEVGSRGGNGTVRNVTLTGGSNTVGGEYGAGFFYDASGNLAFDHVAVVGNTNCTDGGGIDYEGDSGATLTITHSTIADNISGGNGGAGWASGDGAVILIQDSTLSGNTAEFAGAMESSGTDTTLAYATVVQNGTATGPSCVEAAPAASHTGANAGVDPDDAQMDLADGTLVSFGSVVALPEGGVPNCSAPVDTTSDGYNFSDDATCGFTGTGDRENAGDPGLGALGANGGYAPTQVPQTGSPLIDGIPLAACQTGVAAGIGNDERDITRPQGPGCDIGAVEVEFVAPLPLVVTPRFTG